MSEAEAARARLRHLAALVVHDLRGPLSAALGYLDLARAADDPARAQAFLGDVELLLEKSLTLVACILDIDQLEDGVLKAHPRAFDLAALLDEARRASRAELELRGLRYAVRWDTESAVELDRELMGRVLENLIDNAARYAAKQGEVEVVVSRPAGRLRIEVCNDGAPVPTPERDTIFGRYYQVEARRASARANRGLGLYFCRLAIEAHGGRIWVDDSPRWPARFVIEFPPPA